MDRLPPRGIICNYDLAAFGKAALGTTIRAHNPSAVEHAGARAGESEIVTSREEAEVRIRESKETLRME